MFRIGLLQVIALTIKYTFSTEQLIQVVTLQITSLNRKKNSVANMLLRKKEEKKQTTYNFLSYKNYSNLNKLTRNCNFEELH